MAGLVIYLTITLVLTLGTLAATLAWEMVHPPRHTVGYAIARGLATDPGDRGLAFESWTLDRPGNVRLAVWDVRGPGRSKAHPLTAVVLHGWGHSRIDTLTRLADLEPWCDRFILYDLRGHGESTGSPSALGQGEADDLLALVERLGENERFVLVGHSMGAVIALRAAAALSTADPKLARQLAGVIAYGPYCEFQRSLQGRLSVVGLPTRPITDLALLIHRLRGVRPASINPADLGVIACPVLIVHGVLDRVSPVEHSRRIAAHLPSCQLHIVNDAAHVDTHLTDPQQHTAMLEQFFNTITQPGDQDRCEHVPVTSRRRP
jgi:pimeloyl-ACP methyl ester carboxylesterase